MFFFFSIVDKLNKKLNISNEIVEKSNHLLFNHNQIKKL